MCVRILKYPSRKTHAPLYIVACALSGCTVYSLGYLINGMIFGTKFIKYTACILILSKDIV